MMKFKKWQWKWIVGLGLTSEHFLKIVKVAKFMRWMGDTIAI